jgi:four helix bundle protein
MHRNTLQQRTKQFHIDVIKLCETLPRNSAGFETAKQIICSAGSVGANYRASARAKSKANFIYKIQIVLEESDETIYWLEIIQNTQLSKDKNLPILITEANELTSIFAAATKTAKSNLTSSNLRS